MRETDGIAAENGPDGLRAIVARLTALGAQETVTVRDIVRAFGASSFVAVMLVPAILVISPLSGIPVFSSICGLSIALVAGQMLAGRKHLWLPGRLLRAQLEGKKVQTAAARFTHVADWIDRRTRRRLSLVATPPLSKLPQALCMLAGLSMPFLELVPLSSSILGTAVVLFGAGFLTRDGLFTLAGAAVMGLAALVPLWMVSVVTEG